MITIFEKFQSQKYSEGDYVLLDGDIFARIDKYGKFGDLIQYYVEIFDKIDNTFFNRRQWIDNDEIKRKLNSEEMKVINLALYSKKYNL